LATENNAAPLPLLPALSGKGRRITSEAKLMGWDKNSLTEWQREK